MYIELLMYLKFYRNLTYLTVNLFLCLLEASLYYLKANLLVIKMKKDFISKVPYSNIIGSIMYFSFYNKWVK